MKKFVTMMAVMMAIMFTATLAVADVTVYWYWDVTGIEVTDMEKEFVEEGGYDFGIIAVNNNPESEIKFEKELIRFTDDESDNYNEAYACLYDEYGLRIDEQEGVGSINETVAVCRTHDVHCIVEQMVNHINKYFSEEDFELYVWINY